MEFFTLHTEEMKEYQDLSVPELLKVNKTVAELTEKISKIEEKTREGYLHRQVCEIVEKAYDIGQVVGIYQLFGGYINTTFGIYTMKDGERQTWLFRKYKRGKDVQSLLFEHKLLVYAANHGFSLGCHPIETLEGKTYHTETEQFPEGEETSYFAVFNYLDGYSTYSWSENWADPKTPENVYYSAARSMAEFHSAMQGFDPGELHGDNIMDSEDILVNDLIAKFPETLKRFRKCYAENGFENIYTELFDNSYDLMKEMCEKSVIPHEDYEKMHICGCQCDFHPGNFKYDNDGNVTASFDYDMSKIDSRLFEVGFGMHYCFASWKSANNGEIHLDMVKKFILKYDEEVEKIGKLPPLSDLEKSYLYEVIVQGSLYDIAWCTSACVYHPDVDPYEYFYYLNHLIASLQWVKDHESEIRQISKEI